MSANYSFPYISIQIIDNTEYTEEDAVITRKEFNGMQVGFFAGGRDNQLIYAVNQAQGLYEFGKPNFKKFGQAAYNVDAALATGNCGMYIMNLRPDTATFANVVIMVKFKVVDTTPTVDNSGTGEELESPVTQAEDAGTTAPTKVLKYSFYAKYVSGATTEDQLLTNAIDMMETEPDAEGYYNMPLCTIYTVGRGTYGNDIRLKFANVTSYDLGYDEDAPIRHTYTLTVMEPSDNGLAEKEIKYGTFDEDAFDASVDYGPSLFMQDVLNDVEYGSQRIHMAMYTSTLNAICAAYNSFADTEVAPGTLDLFTFMNLDGTINSALELDETVEGYVNLFALDGFQLQGGTDGWEGLDTDAIEQNKIDLLIRAYAGEIDPMIKSRFSSPCNFNLDANYDIEVKKQMAALANERKYDCMTYLDTNFVSTTSGLVTFLTHMRSVYGYNVIKECHCYRWRDVTYTGKVCDMTITHWLAKALPNHMADSSKGLGVAMAQDVAILRSRTDYVPGSFKPVIDPDSNDIKDTIFNLRANCYQTLTYNSVQRSTAITSCQSKSDRLLEKNEYIVQKAIKIAYDILASKMYKLGEDDDRARYQEDATDIIGYQLSTYVKSVSVDFEMTSEDKKKSLLRLVLHLTFNTTIQKGELKLYLDPRVAETVAVSATE